MQIHPTAMVHSSVCMGEGVEIGPYAIIEEDVEIGSGSSIGSHTVVGKYTAIGDNCRIFPHAVIGMPPQDLKFKGEKTTLVIGDNTVVREFATINRGTSEGGGRTVVGPHNFIMAYVHLAHDCHLGENVIIANAANLAGHIEVEDYAVIGGLTAVHQFVRIGAYAIVGGASGIPKDIVPFAMASGNRVQIQGLNLIGLRRHGFPVEDIKKLKQSYKLVFGSDLNTSQALEAIESQNIGCPAVERLVAFIKTSERGICKQWMSGSD